MPRSSIDKSELSKFLGNANWHDKEGNYGILHQINPLRVDYILSNIRDNFTSIEGLKLLDIGCGGGLASNAAASAGLDVTGIDASESSIKAAQKNAPKKSKIKYKISTAEGEAKLKATYDVILALEVLEHVGDKHLFFSSIAKLLKKTGIVIVSTINRNLKAKFLAIKVAEDLLGWVEPGTHDYDKFVEIEELQSYLNINHLEIISTKGLSFSPLHRSWCLSDDVDVNYFALAKFSK